MLSSRSLGSSPAGEHDVIIDAATADIVRSWLASAPNSALPHLRVWLLLAPEQRRMFPDLMASPRAGYLLRPVRRETLIGQVLDRVHRSPSESTLRQGLHVLLAEDDPVNARLVAAMLEKSGHRVSCAATGQLAVELVASSPQPPDLVLMDMEMPETGGLAATRAIRAFEASRGMAGVPILALTANAG